MVLKKREFMPESGNVDTYDINKSARHGVVGARWVSAICLNTECSHVPMTNTNKSMGSKTHSQPDYNKEASLHCS